ncbi:MAG: hypothetical protein U0736_22200 [Gemmataceae bacterium]
MSKKSKKGSQKTFASRRTMNPPGGNPSHQQAHGMGNAQQEHDVNRRLGSFGGTGEHPRTGNPGHQ